MLTHIVCFKYKPSVDGATRERHRAMIRSLADMDGIVDLKVGADVVRQTRSYDTAILATFRDRAALDAYTAHPRHLPVVEFAKPITEQIVSVDFED